MDIFAFFLLTLLIALIGGTIGYLLKLPVGAMVGAMAAVVLFNLITEKAVFYSDLRVALQIFGGAMIGCRIGKKDLAALKTIVMPTVLLIVSMVFLNLIFGILMYQFSDLDIATSLFSSAPGGVSDMAIISADLGANPAYVAILQLCRILTIFIIMPPIFKKLILGMKKKQARKMQASIENSPGSAIEKANSVHLNSNLTLEGSFSESECVQNTVPMESVPMESVPMESVPMDSVTTGLKGKMITKKFLLLMILAVAGGLLLWILRVTAGAMIGAMLATAAFGIFFGEVPFPKTLRFGMQIFSGAFIGIQLDRAGLAQMSDLIVPLLIMIGGILCFVFVVAYLMHKLTGLDLPTCLLASTPGGVQEMALLSEDLGADTPKIAIMQTARLMAVILFFPTMLGFITKLFS